MPIIRYKVLVAQVDSDELDMQQELGLDSVNVYFNNTTNGFIADNSQDAIEELLDLASPLRVPISLVYNGTLSNGNWIGYSNLLPGDATPIVAPITGSLVGFTWSNSNSSADFTLSFRKNSTGATPFYSWSTTNTRTASITLPSPESFTSGDTIFVQYGDDGQNANDATIVLLFKS